MNYVKQIRLLSLLLIAVNGLEGQVMVTEQSTERQITRGAKGHTIHNTQVFSPDNAWIVYDTRNDGADIASTNSVEKVNVYTGEVVQLYRTANPTIHGPGVGAATYSSVEPKVLFIHGLRNSSLKRPYGFTRRTGVMIDERQSGILNFLDARDITPPFTPGALRGGTHAHTWSSDGKFISFTYNDYILEQQHLRDPTINDLRVVGVMAPIREVTVKPRNDGENHDGELFSVVVTRVTEQPRPGSDDIDRAFDEGWIGTNGYIKANGTRQVRAIAFQGNIRDAHGQAVTELFVADLPNDLTKSTPGAPLQGTETTRPQPPALTHQRRITFTTGNLFPGTQGVRHWLRTTPDGSRIFFLMKDKKGLVQIGSVSPNGGAVNPVTANPFPVQTPFNVSPNGQWIAYGADNSVFLTHLPTGETKRLTPKSSDHNRPENGIVWSNDGQILAYNRYVMNSSGRFLQIFTVQSGSTQSK